MYYNPNLYTTFITDINTPQAATIIIQIHKTKQKTNPIHTIINIYRRPHWNTEFASDLQSTIDEIIRRHPTTTITIQGDININLLNISPRHNFYSFLTVNNFRTTITTPTRTDPHYNTKTIIDVILTTRAETQITAGTISPPLSDHLPIYTIFHKPPPRRPKNENKTLSRPRYEKLKHKIVQDAKEAIITVQAETTPTTTTTQQFHNIQHALQHTIEAYERKPKPRRNPWCSPQIKSQIKKQHTLHEKRLENPTEQNIRAYSTYRNKLRATIKNAKKEHFRTKIEDSKKDPKQQAKILQSLIPGKAQSRTSPTLLVYEGKTYTDPTDIANALNDRYITIGHKTNQTIPQYEEECIMPEPEDNEPPPFELQHTTIDIVTKAMNNINPNKANDIYKIKPALIKDMTPFLAPILTHLFNKAIDEHDYPDSLKVTKVIELYKSKDPTNPANYRPISLLPIIAKIFDTIINNQMMTHLTTNNIISPTQYAFRPNSSTTLALQTILNKLYKHKSQKQPLLAIYVDLSKAYDTISHAKLIHMLRHDFNFTEQTTAFFSSYFRNRQQSTHTQHAQSKFQTITHGVPQGSTLSTTFFLLYINKIIRATPNSKVYTYADDTTLIITAPTLPDLQILAQSELANLIKYFHTNNLVPNPSKTVYSIFYPRNPTPINITIGKATLKQEPKAKLLGLIVQDDLKYNKTVSNIISKLQPHIHSFRYATRLLPPRIMRDAYFTHIYPHLIGNISIWGSDDPNKTYLQPLIRIQKKIVRIIRNKPPRSHTKPIMKELNILNITNLYTLRVSTEMHPFIHQHKQLNRPEHNHHYTSVSDIHDHSTRYSTHNRQYHSPDHVEHFTARSIKVWNSLPPTLTNISSLQIFKQQTKLYLLDKQSHN